MTHSSVSEMAEKELITMFTDAAREMGAAVLDSDSRRANRAFGRMEAVDKELRSRGKAAHEKLFTLLAHNDRFVRYYAAKVLLSIVPDRAREVIEENARLWFDAIAGDAGMTLLAL